MPLKPLTAAVHPTLFNTVSVVLQIEILSEHQQIRVLVDGQQLCDFTHRVLQIRTVTALKITGDARLTKVA